VRSDQCCRSGVFNKHGRSERGEPMANSEPTFENVSKGPLLWGLPAHLSRDLFKGATPVRLSVDQVLFHAGDAGDGCYRVDDGLLKVTMLSPSGNERILCFLGPGAVVGELSMIDGPAPLQRRLYAQPY